MYTYDAINDHLISLDANSGVNHVARCIIDAGKYENTTTTTTTTMETCLAKVAFLPNQSLEVKNYVW